MAEKFGITAVLCLAAFRPRRHAGKPGCSPGCGPTSPSSPPTSARAADPAPRASTRRPITSPRRSGRPDSSGAAPDGSFFQPFTVRGDADARARHRRRTHRARWRNEAAEARMRISSRWACPGPAPSTAPIVFAGLWHHLRQAGLRRLSRHRRGRQDRADDSQAPAVRRQGPSVRRRPDSATARRHSDKNCQRGETQGRRGTARQRCGREGRPADGFRLRQPAPRQASRPCKSSDQLRTRC